MFIVTAVRTWSFTLLCAC